MTKVGVIGLGIGLEHVKSLKRMADVELWAICDAIPDRLASASSLYDVPRTFTDYEELLAQKEIDAVTVALPNYLHRPVVLAALGRHKHVLVEKPMALNAAEAELMVQKAQEMDRCLMVMMNYRFLPHHQYLKRLIERGELGRVYYIKTKSMRGG